MRGVLRNRHARRTRRDGQGKHMLITPNQGQLPPGFRDRASAVFRWHAESMRRTQRQRGDRLDGFSVGNFRGSRRPTIYRGNPGRRPSRVSYPWHRRSGFVGNGSSVPLDVPTTSSTHLVTPPGGGPPPAIPDGGAGIPINPPAQPPPTYPPGQAPPTYPPAAPCSRGCAPRASNRRPPARWASAAPARRR